jgi:surface polysaccharide O-acyltransferase-like enzyme
MVNTCSNCLSAHTHESNHKLYNTINIFISIESLFHTYDLSNPNKIKRWPNNKAIRYVTYHQTGKYLMKRKCKTQCSKTEKRWFEQQRMVIDTQQQHVWCDQLPQHYR